MHLLLLLLLSDTRRLVLGELSSQSASLLGPKVKWSVLLVLVELAEVLPLLLVRDGQHTRNRLADSVAGRVSGFI